LPYFFLDKKVTKSQDCVPFRYNARPSAEKK
jgi:hypothetical protein